jgi:hypothetical protein
VNILLSIHSYVLPAAITSALWCDFLGKYIWCLIFSIICEYFYAWIFNLFCPCAISGTVVSMLYIYIYIYYFLEYIAYPWLYLGSVYSWLWLTHKVISSLLTKISQEFHGKYYHPSNARIWFYGDDDPTERLRILSGTASESHLCW